ncbi:hypothetical protein KY330_05350 [Candidatus Woesearchaeota archaeon]|nr:hypothetical protein [Candidatus Woesearchaeota archaeon]
MGIMALFHKKKFNTWEVASDEVAILAFAFLVAKLYPAVTTAAWYWYLIIMVIFWIPPVKAMMK